MRLLRILGAVNLAEQFLLKLVVEDLVVNKPSIGTTAVLIDRICDILRLKRVVKCTAFWWLQRRDAIFISFVCSYLRDRAHVGLPERVLLVCR